MNIRFLGAHSRESKSSRFVSLLIDDILAVDAGALTSSLSMAEQRQLKAILLSHEHYDHIRDIPAIALNLFNQGGQIQLYSTAAVGTALADHLLNGRLYPKFLETPPARPTVNFNPVCKHEAFIAAGYQVVSLPVNHNESVGYQVSDSAGRSVVFTGDTGPGFVELWRQLPLWDRVLPQLLIMETTVPNEDAEFASRTGHLTPRLLKDELEQFQRLKGYLPPVTIVHMDPR